MDDKEKRAQAGKVHHAEQGVVVVAAKMVLDRQDVLAHRRCKDTAVLDHPQPRLSKEQTYADSSVASARVPRNRLLGFISTIDVIQTCSELS